MSSPVIDLLLALSHTCGLQCFIALRELGPLPLTQTAVAEAIGESDESVKRGLRRLKVRGLAICDTIGGKETNWRLAPPAYQIPLPLNLLDLSTASELPVYPALVTNPSQAQLQAGAPALDVVGPAMVDGGQATPQKAESLTPRKPESRDADIIIIESESIKLDSYKNNNKGQNATPQKPESPENSPASRPTRHIADILRALKLKGRPAPISDDPFPEDLRICVERLVKVGCSRKRAETAVARSPWSAETILSEIGAWKARKASPAGTGITTSGFPFLVAARIEAGDHCPRSDEAVELEDTQEVLATPEAPEQLDDVPDEPPPFVPVAPSPPVCQPIEGMWVNNWSAALSQLQLEMPHSTFKTWFNCATLSAVEQGDDELIFAIAVPTQYQVDWLTNRMTGTVTRTLTQLAGQRIVPKFVVRN